MASKPGKGLKDIKVVKLNYGLIFFTLLIFSCLTPYEPQEESGLPEEGGIISLAEELFTEGWYDEEGRKVTVFLLNDNAYWSEYGYTLWTLEKGAGEESFTSREVCVSKITGDKIAGYGIVICHAMRIGYGETMLTIMINTEQNYTIGKVIGGNYKSIKPWTYSAHLLKGYGRENKLNVMFDKEDKEYSLIINNHEVEKFKDETDPVCEGGRNGYIAVISPQDKFPQTAIEITFSE